jgi:hypothetical protein
MGRQLGTHRRSQPNLELMVAIASGTSASVKRWASLLEHAAIPSVVAQPCSTDGRDEDFVELWVDRDDADEARQVLQTPQRGCEALIW